MAAYPLGSVIAQVVGTKRVPKDGFRLLRATSGKPRIRSFFSQTWYEFSVVHDLLLAADTTVSDHYAAEKLNTFVFTYQLDGAAYNVMYVGEPEEVPAKGQTKKITSRLIQV